jgi:hypothetical protein
MPTRKQRRRSAKQKRHEYEFVYVDAEGNELEELPDELDAEVSSREERRNGKQAAPARSQKARAGSQRGGRTMRTRTPPPPSWERAGKRALMLGVAVFFLFGIMNSKSGNRWVAAAIPAVIYTALFVPFTYTIDRFAYNRWQRRQQMGGQSPGKPAKRR